MGRKSTYLEAKDATLGETSPTLTTLVGVYVSLTFHSRIKTIVAYTSGTEHAQSLVVDFDKFDLRKVDFSCFRHGEPGWA